MVHGKVPLQPQELEGLEEDLFDEPGLEAEVPADVEVGAPVQVEDRRRVEGVAQELCASTAIFT